MDIPQKFDRQIRDLVATHLLERHHQFHLLLRAHGPGHHDVSKAKALHEDALELADAVGLPATNLKAAA